MTPSILFCDPKGSYSYVRPRLDLWDESRDARNYSGEAPVVAHPPCARWCALAYVVQARYGYKVGDDHGTFASALANVRRVGGVLEHPGASIAWKTFGLMKPNKQGWVRDMQRTGVDRKPEWTCEVYQRNYGHKARKRTWLLYVGDNTPFDLKWGRGPEPEVMISEFSHDCALDLPRISGREASATPPAFRDVLIALAKHSRNT